MENETQTATSILMEVMDGLSSSEARKIVVIYTNEDDEVVMKSNGSTSDCLGLLEFAKFWIINERINV